MKRKFRKKSIHRTHQYPVPSHLYSQRALRNVASFIPALIWAVLILVLSLLPAGTVRNVSPFTFEGADKMVHGLMYFVLVLLLISGGVLILRRGKWKTAAFAFATAVLFGLMVEVLQAATGGGRHFELMDIIANISGTFIGCVAFIIFRKTK